MVDAINGADRNKDTSTGYEVSDRRVVVDYIVMVTRHRPVIGSDVSLCLNVRCNN